MDFFLWRLAGTCLWAVLGSLLKKALVSLFRKIYENAAGPRVVQSLSFMNKRTKRERLREYSFWNLVLRTVSKSRSEWPPGQTDNPGLLWNYGARRRGRHTCHVSWYSRVHLPAFAMCVCVWAFMLIRHPSLSQFQTYPPEVCKSRSS